MHPNTNIKNRITPGTIPPDIAADKRYKILETAMKRQLYKQDSLIEILHIAQGLFGYLDNDLLKFVASRLKLPPSKVFGVATFYHYFTLKPRGEHVCVVCMGTACYVKGADKVLQALETKAGVKSGETTPDGKVSILTARCIGACGLAPAVVYDGTVVGKQTPESAIDKLNRWLSHGS